MHNSQLVRLFMAQRTNAMPCNVVARCLACVPHEQHAMLSCHLCVPQEDEILKQQVARHVPHTHPTPPTHRQLSLSVVGR